MQGDSSKVTRTISGVQLTDRDVQHRRETVESETKKLNSGQLTAMRNRIKVRDFVAQQQTKGKEDQLSKNQDDLIEELIERRQDLEHIRKLKESAMPKASRALARPEWNRKNAMAGLGTTFRATAEDAGVFMVAYT